MPQLQDRVQETSWKLVHKKPADMSPKNEEIGLLFQVNTFGHKVKYLEKFSCNKFNANRCGIYFWYFNLKLLKKNTYLYEYMG